MGSQSSPRSPCAKENSLGRGPFVCRGRGPSANAAAAQPGAAGPLHLSRAPRGGSTPMPPPSIHTAPHPPLGGRGGQLGTVSASTARAPSDATAELGHHPVAYGKFPSPPPRGHGSPAAPGPPRVPADGSPTAVPLFPQELSCHPADTRSAADVTAALCSALKIPARHTRPHRVGAPDTRCGRRAFQHLHTHTHIAGTAD